MKQMFFFQQKPEDYDSDLLSRQDPISFHKFISTDPIRNYDQWFKTFDDDLLNQIRLKAGKEEL
jgi:hypothetical protein